MRPARPEAAAHTGPGLFLAAGRPWWGFGARSVIFRLCARACPASLGTLPDGMGGSRGHHCQ